MKVLAFYNEKGGVGKSTFTLMMASWLHYKHGIKAGVADFNTRLTEYRKDEIQFMKDQDAFDEQILQDAWPLVPENRSVLKTYGQRAPKHAIWLDQEIHKGKLKDLDVLLIDLPGAINGQELAELVCYRILNFIVIPFDKDQQAMSAALSIKNFLRQSDCCRFCGFINMIQTGFGRKEDYCQIKDTMESRNLPILPDMVSFSERMKHFQKVDVMRSTFSYPDWNQPTYQGSKDLGIENLFIDIIRELKRIPDMKGTQKTDLSFVDSLQKDTSVQSLNRQLNGTSFAQYEVLLPEDMKTRFKKNR